MSHNFLRLLGYFGFFVTFFGIGNSRIHRLLEDTHPQGETLNDGLNTKADTSNESLQDKIRINNGLLHKLEKYDNSGVVHSTCLEVKYLNYLSIRLYTKCVMLFKEPGCRGTPSQDGNAIVNFGKESSLACGVAKNLTTPKVRESKQRENKPVVLIPTTTSTNPPVEKSDTASEEIDIDDQYDLSNFPAKGELEPWDPKKINISSTIIIEKDDEPSISLPLINASSGTNSSTFVFEDHYNLEALNNSYVQYVNISTISSTDRYPPLADGHKQPEIGSCERKCEATDKYGIYWTVCLLGTGFRQCPGDTQGSVEWQCGSNGEFVQPLPNYSQCHSNWIMAIESSLAINSVKRTNAIGDMTETVVGKVRRTSASATKAEPGTPQYFGHEIPGILNLVDHVNGAVEKSNLDEAESLASSSVVILDSVASEVETWTQLPQRERAAVGTKLINTMESTMFGLVKVCRKFGRRKYEKSFNRSPEFKIRVGTVQRAEFGEYILGEDMKEPIIRLPAGWTALAPRDNTDDEVHFVRMTMGKEYMRNIIPSNRWDTTNKQLNSQLATFSVANANNSGSAKINFHGEGIRITFPHDAEAWGSESDVPRRLHTNEKPTVVLGSSICVFWDPETLDWSSEGCRLIASEKMSSTCECQHLTSFAVLMDVHQYIGKDTGIIVLTRLLCTLSSIFLLVTIVLFKKLHTVRNPRSSVTIHLSFCLLMGNILILTLMDRDNFPLPSGLCAFVGMTAHFTFLSAFVWMGIEGFIVYKMVVDVFDSGTENKIRLRLIAYGIPLVIVLTFLIIHVSTDSSIYGGELYCWIQGNYIWSFIVPVISVCLVNFVVLVIALRTAFNKSNSTLQVKQSAKQSKTMIIGTMSLTCLLGLTWIFGLLLTISNANVAKIGAYFFTIFNASQGVFIFIFHCWMNKQVRNALRRRVVTWQSTALSNSTDNSKIGGKQKQEPSIGGGINNVGSSGTYTTTSTSVTDSNVEENKVKLPLVRDNKIPLPMIVEAALPSSSKPSTEEIY